MKSNTQLLIELWREARTRFTNQLELITESDLQKKLAPSPNSLGFLIRHIGDIELLFAKNVFGSIDIKVIAKTVIAKTVIAKTDTGGWTNLAELKEYSDYAFKNLLDIIEKQTQEDWKTIITTKEFGAKTKSEAFGRIISHAAYHAGQMAIINKYGSF
jgi:uncharacterized damage-inducible protein DinB